MEKLKALFSAAIEDLTERAEQNVWKFGGIMLVFGVFIGMGFYSWIC